MQGLVEMIAKSLVTNPDACSVNVRMENGETVYEIIADSDDLGRIIGREGKIAKAIRTVVKAAAIKEGTKVQVDILDRKDHERY